MANRKKKPERAAPIAAATTPGSGQQVWQQRNPNLRPTDQFPYGSAPAELPFGDRPSIGNPSPGRAPFEDDALPATSGGQKGTVDPLGVYAIGTVDPMGSYNRGKSTSRQPLGNPTSNARNSK